MLRQPWQTTCLCKWRLCRRDLAFEVAVTASGHSGFSIQGRGTSRSFSLNAILDAALLKSPSLFCKASLLGSYFSPFKSLAMTARLVAAEM
jgi:hypothetical protein